MTRPESRSAAAVSDAQVRLSASGLEVRYPGADPHAHPAFSIDALELLPGRSRALVGESGSGKTTALRTLLGLVKPTAGEVSWQGRPLTSLRRGDLRSFRTSVQLIPQDVDGALDPRQTIGSAIAEGWRAGGKRGAVPSESQADVVARLLAEVDLPGSAAQRHPHQLSGGQRQRAIIARALAVGPRILLLDEPTSGLDATVVVRILELIERLRTQRGLGILLISHDLGVVTWLCPDTIVLYQGEVVESGPTERLLISPRHPYTAALRRSVPELGVPFRPPLEPSPEAHAVDASAGCRFGPRCAYAAANPCANHQELRVLSESGALVRCGRADDLGPLDPLVTAADGNGGIGRAVQARFERAEKALLDGERLP